MTLKAFLTPQTLPLSSAEYLMSCFTRVEITRFGFITPDNYLGSLFSPNLVNNAPAITDLRPFQI